MIELPVWVGEEVSDDPRYLNVNLAKHPYRLWMPTGRTVAPWPSMTCRDGDARENTTARAGGDDVRRP